MATQFAEVIYETGSKSVVSVDNLEQFKAGLKIQHDRAKAGEVGGPTGHSAERIKRVLIYDDHPGQTLAVRADDVNALVDGMKKADGTLDENQLIAALRDEASPVFTQKQGRHDSDYRIKESDEMDLTFLDANEEGAS